MTGLAIAASLLLSACALGGSGVSDPIRLAQNLDLERFMGRWYVIANIPTPFDDDAFNATEDYELLPDGKVATTFTYRKGALDGPRKVSRPTGFISDENDAVWKMQFIWPFKADYRVAFVDDEHTVTIVGRDKRDYVWLMARGPSMDDAAYERHVAHIEAMGYDISQLRRIPHGLASREAVASGS